ncbi:MOLPALP family lipoprotein [Mesoplasma photuris]|uniref:MOLPALP family lipoprotein n=1 Tax=Mesoplasma photuris TaxID=217731 RepID=UPI0004E0E462|nr:MOLPALP family lipoprotein [Mesoplasma photuris]
MKKLLAVLGVITISASTTATVACTTADKFKSEIEATIYDLIKTSEVPIKSAILNVSNNEKKFNESYINGLLGGQNAVEVIGEHVDPSVIENGNTSNVLMTDMLLNYFDNEKYTLNANDMKKEADGSENEFLKSLNKQHNNDEGSITGTDETFKIIQMVSGIVSLVFSSNFSDSMFGMVNQVFGINAVKDIVNKLPEMVNGNETIKNILGIFEPLTPEKVDEKVDDLFNKITEPENIEEPSIKTYMEKGNIFSKIKAIVYYFDKMTDLFSEVPYDEITNSKRIFDEKVDNNQVIYNILTAPVDGEEFTNVLLHFDLAKFVNIIAQVLNNPNNNIYNFQKLIAVLLGSGIDSTTRTQIDNPIVGTIKFIIKGGLKEDPAMIELRNEINSNGAEGLGIFEKIFKPINDLVDKLESFKGIFEKIEDIIDLLLNDLANQTGDGFKPITALIKLAISLNLVPDNIKNILEALIKNDNLKNPLKSLYNGNLLKDVFEAMGNENLATYLPNINSFLSNPLATSLKAFGVDEKVFEDVKFLYAFKENSIVDLINFIRDTVVKKTSPSQPELIFNLITLQPFLKGILGSLHNLAVLLLSDNKESEETFMNEFKKAIGLDLENNVFYTGTLLYALSALYGNVKGDDDESLDNDYFKVLANKRMQQKTMSSMTGLISSLINWLDINSMNKYVEEKITPYLESKNWTTSLISYENFGEIKNDAVVMYKINYKNDDLKRNEDYVVTLKQVPVNGNDVSSSKKWIVYDVEKK